MLKPPNKPKPPNTPNMPNTPKPPLVARHLFVEHLERKDQMKTLKIILIGNPRRKGARIDQTKITKYFC
jgi:hypothetical protein